MNAPAEPYSLMPSRQGQGEGRIEIDGVSFRYADDRPFLFEDLNLQIAPGKTVAIMGPSGSGKSTLAKLLQGFYWPTVGQIKIDGIDIRHLAANELRANFGVVPQETVLFSGSIYENLCDGQRARELRAGGAGLQDGRDSRRHRGAAPGLPDADRRTRRGSVRRTEAAAGDRAGAAEAARRC